jgi:hypothetical protein
LLQSRTRTAEAHVVITRLLVAAAALAAFAGCSSAPDGSAPTADRPATSATAPAEIGDLGDAMEVAAGAPAEADAGACELERDVVESAIEMFAALTGAPPVSEDELVSEGMLVEPSTRFDLAADGTVVPAPGSPCR